MTLLTSLSPYIEEIKLGALVIGAGALFAGAFYLGGLGPKSSLEALQAQDWESKYQASEIANTVLQGQLRQSQMVSQNNSTVIQGLNDANAKITADRDGSLLLAQRLLNLTQTTAPAFSLDLPKAANQSPASSPSGNPGTGQVEGLLVAAADESQECAIAYNGLLAQLKPQL